MHAGNASREDRMATAHSSEPIVVTHEGGLRFGARIRTHRIVTDQSVRAGGDDSAPSPLELIPAALGSCVALYVHQFCTSRGLPSDGLRVEVTPRYAAGPSRIAELAVRVCLPAELPPHAAEMLERVVRSCPVHNTLAPSVAISVAIGAGADVLAACG
jgi:putative redox protein